MSDIIEKVLSYLAILSTIQNHSLKSKTILESEESQSLDSWKKNSKLILHSSCLVRCSHFESLSRSKSLRTFFILTCESIVRSSLFDARSQTNNSQRKRLIYINTEESLVFWMKNVFDKLLEMIRMIKEKNRNLIKNYNEQIDVIDEYLIERNEYLTKKKTFQKKNIILQNELIDQKFVLRTMKQKLKILETTHDRIRNVRTFIMSSFVFSSSANHAARMIANINTSNRFEKTKRFVVISNSTIFIEDKAKFEHWLAIMQSKLKTNENWYLIERMIMTYVSIKLNEETYKHISIRLNKNSARRYLIVDEMFENLKRMYANFNKMQTTMNAFTRLTQIDKYAKFHVFWNEFQRLMKEMNFSNHFLLIELKRKMSYRLQNVMSFEFNIIQNIYELARLTQLKEDHYKRIDDVKFRRRSNAITTAEIEIETKAAINRTINITTISINEKAEQISVETTIWNSNQFRISTFRVISRTFNSDSTKKKLMKADKCFNCDESKHLNRDCSKSRKFKIAEMNVKRLKNAENSRKE